MENEQAEGAKKPESGEEAPSYWNICLLFLLFAVFLAFAVKSWADPDLWGHLLFGQDMLSTGSVTRMDPYSFLSHPDWINHEWLSEVLFGLSWQAAGSAGLVLLKAIVVLVILALIYGHLRRNGLDVLRAGLVVVVVMLPLMPGLRTIRPHMFTHLLFTLTLLLLFRIDEGAHRRAWLLPILIALWINFHGGVLAGLGAIGLWALGWAGLILYRERKMASLLANGRGHVWGAVAACGLALLVNPYGVELPRFLLETGTVDRPYITEWQPLDLTSLKGALYLLIAGVGGASILKSSRRLRPSATVLLPVMALLPFTALRHLSLFGISVTVLAAPQISDVLRRRSHPRHGGGLLPKAVAGLMLAVGLVFLASVPKDLGCIPVGDEYPVESVSLIEDSGASGLLVVTFSWGEYAIWHLHDRLKVSMDGRRETVYPDSIYQNHLAFRYGFGDWDKVLDSHPVDIALVPTDEAPDNLLSLKPGWGLAHRDSVAAVYVREGSRHAEMVRGAQVTRRHPERIDEVSGEDERLCFP